MSVRIGGFAGVALIGFCLCLSLPEFPPLEQRMQTLAKHPRLLTLTDHLALGHPLVRQIHGTWVGGSCAQVLTAGALLARSSSETTAAERSKLNDIMNFERRQVLADVRNGRPDVILVDTLLQSSVPFDWLAWAKSDPELQTELRRYREVEGVGRVRIFRHWSAELSRAGVLPDAPLCQAANWRIILPWRSGCPSAGSGRISPLRATAYPPLRSGCSPPSAQKLPPCRSRRWHRAAR